MTTLTKTAFFNVDPEVVWGFLTDKDKLGAWYHAAEDHLQEGQEYSLYDLQEDGSHKQIIWGRVVEMRAPHHLVTTFCIGPFGGRETTLTWDLKAAAGGTCLTLHHAGIEEATGEAALALFMALDRGWDAHLGDLRGQANAA